MTSAQALYLLLTFIVAGGGAYLGSYLKKKGENLATHEDIGKLVDQMAAVTMATKEIEAKISDDAWSRQKRSELRRDIMLETVDGISRIRAEMGRLMATTAAAALITNEAAKRELAEQTKSCRLALICESPKLLSLSYRLALVTGNALQREFAELRELLLAARFPAGGVMGKAESELASKTDAATTRVLEAIRDELGFPPVAITPQSTESSAAPSLGRQGPEAGTHTRR
jgi:hypothetical protein